MRGQGSSRHAAAGVLLALLFAAGCGARIPDHPAGAPPTTAPHPGVSASWPLPPLQAEHALAEGDIAIREQASAGSGVTGAMKLTVEVIEAKKTVTVKWKAIPRALDGWNNSPRKELAAYAVQKLFLEPRDYVVPTTVMRCFETAAVGELLDEQRPNVANSRCTLGMLTIWLDEARPEKNPLDVDRFGQDANYAYHVADFNVLTYLVDHRDGRFGNFLVSEDERDRRVFAIDNGISFEPWIYNYFVTNWNRLYVPAVSKAAIEKLRRVDAADLRHLGVVTELRRDRDGIYRNAPPSENLDPAVGAKERDGIIQFGLTASEIDALHDRLVALLGAVDRGALPTF